MSEGGLVEQEADGKGIEGELLRMLQDPGFVMSGAGTRLANLPESFQTLVELTGTIDTRLADTNQLADAIGDFKISLLRMEELVYQTHVKDHHNEEYENRLSALIEQQTGTEREDAMMKHVEKCADGLLEAVQTSIEAKLDQKIQAFQEKTSMATKRLEEMLELLLANQPVSHPNFDLLLLLNSSSCVFP